MRVQIGFDVEVEQIDALPAAWAAAHGFPMLMQGKLAAGDVVDGVDVGIEDIHFALVEGRGGSEEVDLRLNDVAEAVDIEQIGIDRIIGAPETGREAQPGAGEQTVWPSPPGLSE